MKKQSKLEETKTGEQLLRDIAESELGGSSDPSPKMKERNPEELLHELRVHQIELEMQNEELRRAQLDLQESRQRFSDLYDFAPVGYFTFTREALIKEVNLTGAMLLKTARQTLINKRFRPLIAPSDLDLWNRHFLNVLREGEKQTCDLTLKRQDGSAFVAGLESIRMGVSGGGFEVHTTVTDISERKRVEAALIESENRYRDLVENSQDLICTHDLEGNLLSVNEAPVRALGYSSEFLLQVKMRDFLSSEQRDKFETYLKEIQEKGRASGILRVQTASGETRYWEYNNTLRTEGVGVPIVRGMAHDITERKKAELALRESEKKYRLVVDNMADNISVMDMDLHFTYVSPSVIKLRGYTSEEVLTQTLEQVVTPESFHVINKAFEEEMELETGGRADPGRSRILELEEYRKDGSNVWIENHLSFIRDEAQKPVGLISLSRDITDRKQAEQALRESEKKYRELYDFLPIPVFEMNFEANITSANRAIYETFRGTEEDLKKGFKGWQLLSPEEIEKSSKNIERLLKGEKVEGTEYTLMRLDGSAFPAIIISSLIYSNGKPVGIRGAVVDISERKKTEVKLQESDERYKALFDGSLDLVYVTDFEGRFIDANAAALDRLGYTREEIHSLNFASFLSEDQLPLASKTLQKIRESGVQMGLIEFRLRTKDGSEIYVETRGSIIMSNGKPIAFQAIARDITERKKVEDRLNQTLENLKKAVGGIIQVIAATVETRDPYTAGHQRRTAELARAIAGEMGLTQDQQDGLLMAGIIHDLGKISIPAEILVKPSKLTEIEYKLIKVHSQVGYDILKNIDFPWPIAEIVLKHHERIDGSGYPQGLKGKEICLEAKILMVADVVEAMASYRPYRPSLGVDAALEEIEKNKGILYDNTVAEVCLKLFREKGFEFE